LKQQQHRATFFGSEYSDSKEGSVEMSSALDQTNTPRSSCLPGTVLSSRNDTNSVTTMFKDIRALIAKSSFKIENDRSAHMHPKRKQDIA